MHSPFIRWGTAPSHSLFLPQKFLTFSIILTKHVKGFFPYTYNSILDKERLYATSACTPQPECPTSTMSNPLESFIQPPHGLYAFSCD